MTHAILWFRRDLRLTDNPALQAALQQQVRKLIPVYIHAPQEEAPWHPGSASNWWLHHSLTALDGALRKRGSGLVIARGKSLATLQKLAKQHGCSHVYWNDLPEPVCRHRDERIMNRLSNAGLSCQAFNASSLIAAPLLNLSGKPYRVFTPFWRALLKRGLPQAKPSPAPRSIPPLPDNISSLPLNKLRLLPKIRWDSGFHDQWKPGEQGALKQFERFLDIAMEDYANRRDRPDQTGTSRLSPHLHFGEIGPIQLLRGIEAQFGCRPANQPQGGSDPYLRQLGWREFALYLLNHFPDTDSRPFDQRFRDFHWPDGEASSEYLARWQRGMTGIPIVDAGMRELWRTGWMHNRVRMIVASLLTKNLGIHWLEGARWFWDTLLDADCANNTFGWQWSAGCGADAAPYFRIFNPVRQGERFDPQGNYIRQWVPEIAPLSDKQLNAPWEARATELSKAGVQLGKTYPKPIVDLADSRKEALQRWEQIKHHHPKERAEYESA